jgi:hypothetical protein
VIADQPQIIRGVLLRRRGVFPWLWVVLLAAALAAALVLAPQPPGVRPAGEPWIKAGKSTHPMRDLPPVKWPVERQLPR